MKKLYLLIPALAFYLISFAQNTGDTLLYEHTIKEKVLNDIQTGLNNKTSAIDSTIRHIDLKVDKLDSMILSASSAKEKAEKLLERVQVVEDKQKAIEENELNIYQANDQSALINLLSMEREIKPLILFNATRNFFSELSQVGNPATYPGYQEWFKSFKDFIDKNKANDIYLKTLDNMLSVTQTAGSLSLLTSGASQVVFSGMSNYINTIARRHRELKDESEKMFQLTITLTLFEADRTKIESNWEAYTLALENLQKQYGTSLKHNLQLINVDEKQFNEQFTLENDADKRYMYLTSLRQKASQLVLNIKKDNPKDWKEKLYFELISIRDLKLKYGELLTEMNLHVAQYDKLISKYKTDKDLGPRMASLETRLNSLKDTFDKTFDPADYINSAYRMYKVM